jgi:hypothetical protein
MALYTERCNAHLTVSTDCTLSFSTHSNNIDSDLGKRRATEVHLRATQKFLLEITELSARNVDHGVCVTKLRAIESCKYLYGLLVAW